MLIPESVSIRRHGFSLIDQSTAISMKEVRQNLHATTISSETKISLLLKKLFVFDFLINSGGAR